MAALLLIILSVCLCARASPPPLSTRNTIFIDEKLEGQAFEGIDKYQSAKNIDAALYRLPTTTAPTHYDVLWEFDMVNLSFKGTVNIQLQATQANVNEIVIHSLDLSINQVRLLQGNTEVRVDYSEDPDLQFLRIRPATALQYNAVTPVVYNLNIDFNANLRDDMNGLYKSWFRNAFNENPRWMATTQFQATYARAAFPCYDEPGFKATFKIKIRRPNAYTSWTGTRLESSVVYNAQQYEDTFHTTPKMSTYLIAVIVAEYEARRDIENANTYTYEVIARPGAMQTRQDEYAFDVGQKLLAEMNRHTDVDYLSMSANLKMTQAAIPDFSAGAMENWGLLTYREAYLMNSVDHTSDHMKQIIAYILSHEIAHMWFGNFVTCDWWDSLWLNEGFARYYQYYLTNWVEDYMGFDTRFVVEQVHSAMLTDSANAHALYNPGIGSPTEVWDMFSTISYNKGAAIIRMTEHLIGYAVHERGLRQYLKANAFGLAKSISLTQELHNVAVSSGAISQYGSDFSIVEYYKTWHDQPGVPVIKVDVNHKTGDMIITQHRFNINTGYAAENFNYQIPITFATASNPDFANTKPTHILKKSLSIINRGTTGDEWVIFNKQQTGYYRVNYDDYTWDLIILALRGTNRTLIHEHNRAQIVDDVFQFARSGLMSYTRAFNILSFLQDETDYSPWLAAMNGFSWLRNRFAGNPALPTLEALIQRWSTKVMNELTYNPGGVANESFMRSYLRRQLAPVMCNIGVAACIQAAQTQFRSLVTSNTEVPVNSRNWVYCTGLRTGTSADFTFMWRRYMEHNVYTEKIQLLQTLGCTPHRESLNALLQSIFDREMEVRPQDTSTAFNTALTGNEGNTKIVLDYVKANLASVTKAYGSPVTPLSNIASRLRTVADITDFESWLLTVRDQLGDDYTRIYNAAESARASIQLAGQILDDLDSYFKNGDDSISASTPAPVVVTTPVTVARPDLQEPVTPVIPSSAATAIVSVTAVAVAFFNIFI